MGRFRSLMFVCLLAALGGFLGHTIAQADPVSPVGSSILTRAGTGAIRTANLADGAVTTIKIAASAVTTAKLADNNVTTAKLVDSVKLAAAAVGWSKLFMFRSTQQTGTGSAQNVAHGLGVTPQWCQAIPEDTTAVGIVAAGYAVTYGSHTSTNCVMTATSGLKFTVFAVAP